MESNKYKLSNDQISTSMAGESVILNHRKGEYYTLNEVGSAIWDMFKTGPKDFSDLVKGILEEYNVSEDECKADVQNIIKELLDEKLIEVA